MTDPRPRVTNRTGNAQQTSVVSTLVNPSSVLARSERMSSPNAGRGPAAKLVSSTCAKSDAKRNQQMWRGVWRLVQAVPVGRHRNGFNHSRVERRREDSDCLHMRERTRRCQRSEAALFVSGAAIICGCLVVAVLMVGPLAARPTTLGRVFPTRARYRRSDGRRQEQHEKSCNRLHGSHVPRKQAGRQIQDLEARFLIYVNAGRLRG